MEGEQSDHMEKGVDPLRADLHMLGSCGKFPSAL